MSKPSNNNKQNNQPKKPKWTSIMFVGIAILLAVIPFLPTQEGPETIEYTQFTSLVEEGKVESIVIKENEPLQVTLTDETVVFTDNPKDPNFKREMLEKEIVVKDVKPNPYVGFIFQILIWVVIFIVIMKLFSRGAKGSINKLKNPMAHKPKTTRKAKFTDVAGVDIAKEELWEVVEFIKNPKRFLNMGIRAPKGVILHGPPGTGKTLLARAVAGEAGVPFYSLNGSDFVEMFVGVGASRVRDLFKNARENSPCVIFIDEFDSLGKKRSNHGSGGNDEREQTVNALLDEMDGFADNSGIVIIAATNRLDLLDPALLRPARFDRHVEVTTADELGRHEILKVHAKGKPVGKTVNLKRLAKRAVNFSGAQLENLLNEGAIIALRNNSTTIEWDHLDQAFERVIIGPKKRNTLTEQEKLVVAYHEAGHAIVTRLLANFPVEKVTVNPAGGAGGYVLRTQKDHSLKTKKELFNEICLTLGGRAAEDLIFGADNITTGAQQDFKQATQIAYAMVFAYGMSELGPIAIHSEDAQETWLRLSDDIKNKAYNEVQNILREAEKVTNVFVKEHSDELKRLTLHLLDVGTIDGEELDAVISGEHIEEETVEVESTEKEHGKIIDLPNTGIVSSEPNS